MQNAYVAGTGNPFPACGQQQICMSVPKLLPRQETRKPTWATGLKQLRWQSAAFPPARPTNVSQATALPTYWSYIFGSGLGNATGPTLNGRGIFVQYNVPGNNVQYVRITQLRPNAEVPFLMETLMVPGETTDVVTDFMNQQHGRAHQHSTCLLAGRHRGGGNILFLDGHVSCGRSEKRPRSRGQLVQRSRLHNLATHLTFSDKTDMPFRLHTGRYSSWRLHSIHTLQLGVRRRRMFQLCVSAGCRRWQDGRPPGDPEGDRCVRWRRRRHRSDPRGAFYGCGIQLKPRHFATGRALAARPSGHHRFSRASQERPMVRRILRRCERRRRHRHCDHRKRPDRRRHGSSSWKLEHDAVAAGKPRNPAVPAQLHLQTAIDTVSASASESQCLVGDDFQLAHLSLDLL